MGLVRVKKELIELISEKDDAIISLEPLVLKEGQDPFVFVFKNQNDLSIRREYLLNIIKLQQCLTITDATNEKDVQLSISKLPPEEQLELMDKISEQQFKIVDLLLIGHKSKIDGELLDKSPELLEIMKENDVIAEFFNKLTKVKSRVIDEKKS